MKTYNIKIAYRPAFQKVLDIEADDFGRTIKTIADSMSGTLNANHPNQDVAVEYMYHSSGHRK